MAVRLRVALLVVAVLVTAAPGCGRQVPERLAADLLACQATIRRDTYGIRTSWPTPKRPPRSPLATRKQRITPPRSGAAT